MEESGCGGERLLRKREAVERQNSYGGEEQLWRGRAAMEGQSGYGEHRDKRTRRWAEHETEKAKTTPTNVT